jgi:hypothetical protein
MAPPRPSSWSPFRRRPRALPAPWPTLDGATWPDPRVAGGSFGAATVHESSRLEAHTDAAHDIVDVVVDRLLPHLDAGAAPQDEAHMRQVCTAAAQTGAGIGLLERRTGGHVEVDLETVDVDVAGALLLAADGLPPMPARQREVARYLLLCGHHLGRRDPGGTLAEADALRAALLEQDHPAVRH